MMMWICNNDEDDDYDEFEFATDIWWWSWCCEFATTDIWGGWFARMQTALQGSLRRGDQLLACRDHRQQHSYHQQGNKLASHEYVKIIKSNNNAGDKIQDGDKVAFKILYNNSSYKKKKSWLGCKCNDYCQRTSCPSELSQFNFFKFYFSNFRWTQQQNQQ